MIFQKKFYFITYYTTVKIFFFNFWNSISQKVINEFRFFFCFFFGKSNLFKFCIKFLFFWTAAELQVAVIIWNKSRTKLIDTNRQNGSVFLDFFLFSIIFFFDIYEKNKKSPCGARDNLFKNTVKKFEPNRMWFSSKLGRSGKI